jgi:virginiamycin B lyase
MRRTGGRTITIVLVSILVASVGACRSSATSPAASSGGASPSQGSASTPSRSPVPSTLTIVSPSPESLPPAARIAARVPVGDPVAPRWLAADAKAVWVHEPMALVRLDPKTGATVATVRTAPISYGYATTGSGAVWQTDFDRNLVLRVDEMSNRVVASIVVGASPEGVAATTGAIWVANHHDGTVSRIDPVTNRVIAVIRVGPGGDNGPLKMAAGASGVWVDVPNIRSVVRIDPATNRVTLNVPLDGPPAVDGSEVWIAVRAGPQGPEAVKIDPNTGKIIASIAVPAHDLGDIGVGLGSVWVTTAHGLSRIDTKTLRLVGQLAYKEVGDVVIAAGAIWVSAEGQPYVLKILPS